MARSHFWHYLQNEEGQPVPAAAISVYLAGSTVAATVFTAESGGTMVTTAPQVSTRDDGFFEFWIADESETGGYTGYKFKIAWSKPGIIDDGEVDNVEVVIASKEVDEDDSLDVSKNKMVSNALAYSWDHRARVLRYDVLSGLVPSGGWTEESGNYFVDIVHGFNNMHPVVMVYDDIGIGEGVSTTAFVAMPINISTIRIYRTDFNLCHITILG